MENGKMNVWKVIDVTRQLLNSICVPVELIESVGKPIQYAVQNLTVCMEAEPKAAPKAAEEENDETANG